VIFILLQRDDIRDRFIRLFGAGDIELTTTALNDAAFRLSRLFLVQTILNAGFGFVITIGLWGIGVPNPILWGVVAALMRFIPYIGAILSAVFPVLLAAAVDPGWSMAIMTLVLFVVFEPLLGHFIEPWVQGQSTGLSPLAIVISAIVWTTLWGPIGLLLATPLTLCLIVLGRHVEGLKFLEIILGDQPALTPPEMFYQRLLAGNSAEAADQAQKVLKSQSLLDYYDGVVLPGLKLAEKDAQRSQMDELRKSELQEGIALIVEDLSDHPVVAEKEVTELDNHANDSTTRKPTYAPVLTHDQIRDDWRGASSCVLCLPAVSSLDAAASDVLANILKRHGIMAAPAPVTRIRELNALNLNEFRVVWICSIDPSRSSAHLHYLARRLARINSKLVICVGFDDNQVNMLADSDIRFSAPNFIGALALTTDLITHKSQSTSKQLPKRTSSANDSLATQI
jgi:AI-2E family transporter